MDTLKSSHGEIKAKQFYRSCMDNTKKNDELDAEPLIQFLKKWTTIWSTTDVSATQLYGAITDIEYLYSIELFFNWSISYNADFPQYALVQVKKLVQLYTSYV